MTTYTRVHERVTLADNFGILFIVISLFAHIGNREFGICTPTETREKSHFCNRPSNAKSISTSIFLHWVSTPMSYRR